MSEEERERRALRDRESAAVLMSTTPTLPGFQIVKFIGAMAAQSVEGFGLGRDFLASLTDAFGGRSFDLERGLDESREQAVADLRTRASRAGANALVGVVFDSQVVSSGNSLMVATTVTGTAVVVTPEPTASDTV